MGASRAGLGEGDPSEFCTEERGQTNNTLAGQGGCWAGRRWAYVPLQPLSHLRFGQGSDYNYRTTPS